MAKKKKQVVLAFLLDETGSMYNVQKETVDGINAYVKKTKKEHGDALFFLSTFNSYETRVIYDGIPLKDVKKMKYEDYDPDGYTPLYDAIGKLILFADGKLKENKNTAVLVTIMTDGEENASTEYNSDMISDIVKRKEKKGWLFTFLGAAKDSWVASGKIGIARGNTLDYAQAVPLAAMGAAAEAAVYYAGTGGSQSTSLFADANVDEDLLEDEQTGENHIKVS
jgi:uncharacterized protein YegL